MNQLTAFIQTICENQKVYILQSEEGFATSFSEEYEYEDGSHLEVICFWSTEALAVQSCFNQWENHGIQALDLTVFLEEWLFGMFEEVALAGINFNENVHGEEIDPLDLVLGVIQELKQQNTSLKLNHFDSLDDIKKMALELKESFTV